MRVNPGVWNCNSVSQRGPYVLWRLDFYKVVLYFVEHDK